MFVRRDVFVGCEGRQYSCADGRAGCVCRGGACGWPDRFCGVVVVKAPDDLTGCNSAGWMQMAIHSEVEVAGDEVFRAPHWSAVLLRLHFSVAKGDYSLGKTGGSAYGQGK
jgi:hypothetical protein